MTSSEDGESLQVAPSGFLAFGPNVIAWNLQLVLFGISLPLLFDYRSSPGWNDIAPGLRRLITTIVLLDACQSALNLAEIVQIVVTPRFSGPKILIWTPLDCVPPIFQGLIAALATGYLARRAVALVQRQAIKRALSTVFALSIAGIVAGSICLFVVGIHDTTGDAAELNGFSANNAQALFSSSSAFTDVLISVSLGMTLSKEIKGFNERTDALLRKMIGIAIRTAAFTAVFAAFGAVFSLIFVADSEFGRVGWAFMLVLPGLYTISILSVISDRDRLREAWTASGHSQAQSRSHGMDSRQNVRPAVEGAPPVSIQLETMRYVEEESGAAGRTGSTSSSSTSDEAKKRSRVGVAV